MLDFKLALHNQMGGVDDGTYILHTNFPTGMYYTPPNHVPWEIYYNKLPYTYYIVHT